MVPFERDLCSVTEPKASGTSIIKSILTTFDRGLLGEADLQLVVLHAPALARMRPASLGQRNSHSSTPPSYHLSIFLMQYVLLSTPGII